MTPNEFLMILRKQWLTLVVLGLVGAMTGFAVSRFTPETFEATSSVFVSTQRGNTAAELAQGSTFTREVVQSYAQLASKPIVLDQVVGRLKLPVSSRELAKAVEAKTPLNTFIVEITVTDHSPEMAADIANAIAAELSVAVERMSPKSAENLPIVKLESVAVATPPHISSGPGALILVTTGLAIGLGLGYVFVLSRGVLDTRIRTESDLQRLVEVPVLSVIPRDSEATEGYRRLATNIEFLDPDSKISSVAVTSSRPDEGKTTTAVRLALTARERAPRVLIVDADLRCPSVANYCGIETAVGLTSVLSGHVALAQAVQPWNSIHILPAGPAPSNPAQIVNSKALAELMSEISRSYDFVVVNCPPLLTVADSLALSRLTDGALIVVAAKTTRNHHLLASLAALETVNSRTLGLVLNSARPRKAVPEYMGQSVAPLDTEQESRAVFNPLINKLEATSPAVGEVTILPGGDGEAPQPPSGPTSETSSTTSRASMP